MSPASVFSTAEPPFAARTCEARVEWTDAARHREDHAAEPARSTAARPVPVHPGSRARRDRRGAVDHDELAPRAPVRLPRPCAHRRVEHRGAPQRTSIPARRRGSHSAPHRRDRGGAGGSRRALARAHLQTSAGSRRAMRRGTSGPGAAVASRARHRAVGRRAHGRRLRGGRTRYGDRRASLPKRDDSRCAPGLRQRGGARRRARARPAGRRALARPAGGCDAPAGRASRGGSRGGDLGAAASASRRTR